VSISISGMGGSSAPQIVSGASTWSSPTTKMGRLFDQIDTGNSGSISQSQFQQAFAKLNPPANFQSLGANATFSQLDPQGTGSVSKADFVGGMTALMRSLSSAGPSDTTSTASDSTAADSASQSLSQSLTSFLQLGSQSSTASDGVGGLLNAWI
jgi:Ca2+-binding EF-hand superfamily protein